MKLRFRLERFDSGWMWFEKDYGWASSVEKMVAYLKNWKLKL